MNPGLRPCASANRKIVLLSSGRRSVVDLSVSILALSFANAIVAAITDDNAVGTSGLSVDRRVALFFSLMLGPVEGWIGAARENSLTTALPLLVISTVLVSVSIVLYLVKRSRIALASGTLVWFMFGYIFSIAIWI